MLFDLILAEAGKRRFLDPIHADYYWKRHYTAMFFGSSIFRRFGL
jgi:hypothetical protein